MRIGVRSNQIFSTDGHRAQSDFFRLRKNFYHTTYRNANRGGIKARADRGQTGAALCLTMRVPALDQASSLDFQGKDG
ncbi:hypothetical protein A1355_21795 [Methylomonas koyamae]|uniref:Uncharacterized protein n=1 Tax=Methylomonas koyamae TaxID=702114 RepID=A0A177NYZ2_9GAMM|nr:hypothetical protein A1355_21795 [Methylomonas koyamae]